MLHMSDNDGRACFRLREKAQSIPVAYGPTRKETISSMQPRMAFAPGQSAARRRGRCQRQGQPSQWLHGLMAASQNGHLEVVRPLLDAKADVNRKTDNGFTALILASQNGHAEVVRALLAAKADVNAKLSNNGFASMEIVWTGEESSIFSSAFRFISRFALAPMKLCFTMSRTGVRDRCRISTVFVVNNEISGRIFCTIIVLSLALPSYSGHKFPDYPVRPAGDYAVTAEKGDVTIGVQPVEDLKEQKTYFETTLTPKGFVPVFIVLQNGSNTDSFLFDKTRVSYGPPGSNSTGPDVHSKSGEVIGIASLATISLVGAIVAGILNRNAEWVQENVVKKEVRSTTLSPGRSVHGFLYVPVPKEGPREKIHLQVPISKTGTSETLVLDLVF